MLFVVHNPHICTFFFLFIWLQEAALAIIWLHHILGPEQLRECYVTWFAGGGNRHAGWMIVKVQNSSINLQEYPLSLIDRGQRRLSFRDSITTYISFGHSFSTIAFGPFSSLFFFCLDYMKKKRKIKNRIAGQQLTIRAWQTLPCFLFFFFFFCWGVVTLGRTSRVHFYFVELFSVRAPQNQWRCVWKY